jgi:hypothetical protein
MLSAVRRLLTISNEYKCLKKPTLQGSLLAFHVPSQRNIIYTHHRILLPQTYHKVYIRNGIIVDCRRGTVDLALKNVFQEDMRGLPSVEPMR